MADSSSIPKEGSLYCLAVGGFNTKEMLRYFEVLDDYYDVFRKKNIVVLGLWYRNFRKSDDGEVSVFSDTMSRGFIYTLSPDGRYRRRPGYIFFRAVNEMRMF